MAKIELGNKVKDTVTGFIGIAISKTEYLHGCNSWGIRSQELYEGKPIPVQWFDEARLEVLEASEVTRVEGSDDRSGGPRPIPPSRSRPNAG